MYGHHPAYFAAGKGENPLVVRELMPILKGRADVYIAGHYHSLEHLKPVDGVNLFISAGGGRPLYPVDPTLPGVLWAVDEFGFAVIEVEQKQLKVSFIGTDGKELHSAMIEKRDGPTCSGGEGCGSVYGNVPQMRLKTGGE